MACVSTADMQGAGPDVDTGTGQPPPLQNQGLCGRQDLALGGNGR